VSVSWLCAVDRVRAVRFAGRRAPSRFGGVARCHRGPQGPPRGRRL